MGSYASQLNRKQRWMVAQYIKSKQSAGKSGELLKACPQTAAATAKAAMTTK